MGLGNEVNRNQSKYSEGKIPHDYLHHNAMAAVTLRQYEGVGGGAEPLFIPPCDFFRE